MFGFLCVSNTISFPAISMALSSTIGTGQEGMEGSVRAASEEARGDAFCPFQLAGVIALHNGAIVLSGLAGTRPSEGPESPCITVQLGSWVQSCREPCGALGACLLLAWQACL